MVKLPILSPYNYYNILNLNEKKLLKYGKVFATKVAIKDALPVDDEKTCLNRLEKGTDAVSNRRISWS
jgi:hypothetical protein